MATKKSTDEDRRNESGMPGGGKGRTDETSKHGVWPYSVKNPPENIDPELRSPKSITPNDPYDESGESELFEFDGQLVGGEDTGEASARDRSKGKAQGAESAKEKEKKGPAR